MFSALGDAPTPFHSALSTTAMLVVEPSMPRCGAHGSDLPDGDGVECGDDLRGGQQLLARLQVAPRLHPVVLHDFARLEARHLRRASAGARHDKGERVGLVRRQLLRCGETHRLCWEGLHATAHEWVGHVCDLEGERRATPPLVPRREGGWLGGHSWVCCLDHRFDEERPRTLRARRGGEPACKHLNQGDATLHRDIPNLGDHTTRRPREGGDAQGQHRSHETHIHGRHLIVPKPRLHHRRKFIGSDHQVDLLLLHPRNHELVHRRVARHVLVEALAVGELRKEPSPS
mmetsp:Transcript_17298/g.44311  ORF Transcript_17298/g.44311 Transcript_17298/m.44311 type:complete len:288 (+) Transcript_17298:1255-2118(+)